MNLKGLKMKSYKKIFKDYKKTAKQKSTWSHKIEASKKGNGPVDRGFIGHKAAKMMKRAKSIEARQNKAIEEKSKLLKNLDVAEKLKLSSKETTDLSILEQEKDSILEVHNLQISYKDKNIFDDISFDIKKGERA